MAEFDKTSGFFTAFREDFGFVYFHREAGGDWFRDAGLWGIGITYIVAVLSLTVLLAFLGTRGYSRWRVTLQLIISLAIGFTIIVAVTGISWQGAEYSQSKSGVTTKYLLNVGLSQANITMTRMNDSSMECIEYHNVKIGWTEIYQAEQEYRQALLQGWPLPVLRIAHYLSLDMGEMRYMRAFRWSGYAAYILLWVAFCSWLLANIILRSKITYAGLSLLLCGCIQLITCIVYDKQQPDDFYIPMDDGKGSQLRLRYYWMFWLTAFTGIFVVLLSVIVIVLDYLRPADMNKFFGTQSEIQSPYEEELKENRNKDIKGMIRQLSIKRSLSLKKKVTIDQEANSHRIITPTPSNNATPSHSEAPTPNVPNKTFESALDHNEAQKALAEEQQKQNGHVNSDHHPQHLQVPEIQVELSDITPEDEGCGDKCGALNTDFSRQDSTNSMWTTESSTSTIDMMSRYIDEVDEGTQTDDDTVTEEPVARRGSIVPTDEDTETVYSRENSGENSDESIKSKDTMMSEVFSDTHA